MMNINNNKKKDKAFPAIVVKVIDKYKVVINRGSINNIKNGQRFLIYHVDEEPTSDPITGESLGYLEIVKGTGKVIYIQEKMSIVESDLIQRPYLGITGFGLEKLEPFDNPKIGDKAKPI